MSAIQRAYLLKRFKDCLAENNEILLGGWSQIGNSEFADIMCRTGISWLCVDLEHGNRSHDCLPDMARAALVNNCVLVSRVRSKSVIDCRRALDNGAQGVIVPMVQSYDEYMMLFDGCMWPPVGSRGVGYCVSNGYGADFETYRVEESTQALFIPMIESVEGIKNLPKMLAERRPDAVFIGPYDLSASLGLTAQLNHPTVVDAIASVQEICETMGVASGIHVVEPAPEILQTAINNGFRLIACATDGGLVFSGLKRMIEG